MNLQLINQQFIPPVQSTLSSKRLELNNQKYRTQQNAQKCLKSLQKHLYTNFTPYQHHFNSQLSNIVLYKSKPKYYLQSLLYDRQRLSLERQLMYYRGAVDEYLSEDFLKSYFDESREERGFIYKKRIKSIISEEILYFTDGYILKAIQLPRDKNQQRTQIYEQSLEAKSLLKLHKGEIILQIKEIQNSIINSLHEGIILLIRTARRCVIYSVKEEKIIQIIETSNEIIDVNFSIYQKNCLQLVEYDGLKSIISTYKMQRQIFYKENQQVKITGLVHSEINFNRNQVILTKSDGLYSYDKRVGKELSLFQVFNLNKQRFYNSIHLKGMYHYTPLIASCQARYIGIYDRRKLKTAVKQYLHHCEQAPPQVLSFYDGCSTSQLKNPVFVCYSPYLMGSSLFSSFNHSLLQNFDQKQIECNFTNDNFSLIYDSGKSLQKGTMHHLYNESVCVYNSSDNKFTVVKIDNKSQVSIQIFSYNELKKKYQINFFSFENENVSRRFEKNQTNTVEDWFQQNLKNKYLAFQTIYKKIQVQQNYKQLQIDQSKEKNKQKKNNKFSKSKNLQEKESLTEIDIQQLLEGQYSNSEECEESLIRRKLNFADLSHFWSVLQQKALHYEQNKQKTHHADCFIISQQQNSQDSSFWQSDQSDLGERVFSFHSKKHMNISILQKLRNEWKD